MDRTRASSWIRHGALQERPLGLGLAVQTEGETLVVALVGAMDLESSPAARAIILDCVDRDRDVLVDLRGVRFLNSAGIAILVEALQRARHRERCLELVVTNAAILRGLQLARLDTIFAIHETPSQALRALPRRPPPSSARA